jgi:hypothetical protein
MVRKNLGVGSRRKEMKMLGGKVLRKNVRRGE